MARIPKPKTERKDLLIGFQAEQGMKRALEDLARERDVPLSQILREAVRQYLEKVRKAAA